jgi:SP family general alpha glucoside:H+ symporter-like MFS transporter
MDQDLEQKNYHAEKLEHDVVYSEKTAAAENKAGAIEAENIEHNMTVLEAVKAYPMASFWAFVMSCTIVSLLSTPPFEGYND